MVARTRPFGVSTHLFHDQRLSREHLSDIGAAGFEQIELFATRTHFDYHSTPAVADLQGWLADSRLTLHSVHAPIAEGFVHGRWVSPLTLASPDAEVRRRAVDEAEQALYIARRVPFRFLVVHLGLPKTPQSAPGENSRDAARRSIEVLARLAEPLGVTLALEVIPNELSRPSSLAHFVETLAEDRRVGICLDFGHAHVAGDVVEAVEVVSEHLLTTHVHDNRGRSDDHLLPFQGTIDWASALTAVQKVGYDGVLLFEVAAPGPARTTLQTLREVRGRMERLLAS